MPGGITGLPYSWGEILFMRLVHAAQQDYWNNLNFKLTFQTTSCECLNDVSFCVELYPYSHQFYYKHRFLNINRALQ